jgi:HAE1 family hydrophobic/amphiphilic exporter-1
MGMDKETALERAGAIRLRPILMTSGSIIAGAIPIAAGIHIFSSGEGAEFRRTLGTVLIGGMISSTLLTLLVVPTAYSLLDSFLAFIRRLFRRRPRVHPQPALATAGATNGSNHTGNTTHLTNSHMQETDAHAPAARQADELTPDS